MVIVGRHGSRKTAAARQAGSSSGRSVRSALVVGRQRLRPGHERKLDLQANPVEPAVNRHIVVGQSRRAAPQPARNGQLAERALIAKRIAILKLDHCIIEGCATVELEQARIVPQLVVAIPACCGERHLIARPGEILGPPGRSCDSGHVKRLVHRIGWRGLLASRGETMQDRGLHRIGGQSERPGRDEKYC